MVRRTESTVQSDDALGVPTGYHPPTTVICHSVANDRRARHDYLRGSHDTAQEQGHDDGIEIEQATAARDRLAPLLRRAGDPGHRAVQLPSAPSEFTHRYAAGAALADLVGVAAPLTK
ncbi:hypothetical protein GCM10009764_84770 [Nocardia ninae]|uniref:Uncharacterized protein n=1 Tax=Nocardia ninae NBRC 108245 TaxID=1210091 RepID=A0A511MAI0_9NOCA|nr:hypothetical protein NN4_16170 [Nocardia ninae NBRC 108245]